MGVKILRPKGTKCGTQSKTDETMNALERQFAQTVAEHKSTIYNPFFWGGCIGGIIGAILGFMTHFKTQRQYQDIIDQIEDLTTEQKPAIRQLLCTKISQKFLLGYFFVVPLQTLSCY